MLIGLKSEKSKGLFTLGIGIILANFQQSGKIPEFKELFIIKVKYFKILLLDYLLLYFKRSAEMLSKPLALVIIVDK